MLVIQKKDITDDVVLSSNITEDEYDAYDADTVYMAGVRVISEHNIYQAVVGDDISTISEWNSATSYVDGNKVYVLETHKIYQANADSTDYYPPNYTSGDTPKWTEVGSVNKGVDLSDTDFWISVSATNYWGAFDAYTDTQTVGVEQESGGFLVDVTLDASSCNSIAMFNCSGQTVTLTLLSSTDEVLWEEVVDLVNRNSTSWTEYFFNSRTYIKSDFYKTFPVFYGSKLRVQIYGDTSAKTGMIVLGYIKKAGSTKWGPTLSILDYSTKDTNSFGITTLTKGKSKKKHDLQAYIKTTELDWYYKFFNALRATPAVYVCHNADGVEFESMLVYGFYSNFSVVVPGTSICDCSLSIEGLV